MSNELIVNNTKIRTRVEGGREMVCATDLWRAAAAVAAPGELNSKRPSDWGAYAGKKYIELKALELDAGITGIYKSDRSGGGATWMIEELATAYAAYISVEFQDLVITTFIKCKKGELIEVIPGTEVQEISRDMRTVIGGITKSVVTHQVAEQLAPVKSILAQLQQKIEAIGASSPELSIVNGYVGRIQVAEMANIMSSEDGRTSSMTKSITTRMNKFCRNRATPYVIKQWRNHNTGELEDLWSVEAVSEWLTKGGGREHLHRMATRRKAKLLARKTGQGQLPLKVA